MCTFAEQNVNGREEGMCWCFEEISLLLLVQRILMYLWYRLLLKMFPRLSVMPGCHDCAGPRPSLPCGQLADRYWKASHFFRTMQPMAGRCYDKSLQQQRFPAIGFCNHPQPPMEPVCTLEPIELEEDLDQLDDLLNSSSAISQIYQSTFLEEEYEECLLQQDIAWDAPVPERTDWSAACPEVGEFSPLLLLLDDYYIDDNLDDHLYAADFQSWIG